MKVIKAQGSNSRTTSEIALFDDVDLSDDQKARVVDKVGTFLVEQILGSVSEAKSPVAGEPWPKLSKSYKDLKQKEGATPIANMELTGEMMDALTFRPTKRGLEIGFFGPQAAKADGHNKLSGRENNTPQRRFLPAEGQSFESDIQSEVDAMLAEEALGSIKRKDLKQIETKADFFDVFREKFPGLTNGEIKSAILGNKDLIDELDDLDLLKWLK